MICPKCNFDQPDGSRFCPNCGYALSSDADKNAAQNNPYGYQNNQSGYNPYVQNYNPYYNQNNNMPIEVQSAQGNSTASLALGIIYCCTLGLALVLGVIGLILGVNSKKTLQRYNQPAGRAQAGIILGAVGMGLLALFFILFFIGFAMSMAHPFYYY